MVVFVNYINYLRDPISEVIDELLRPFTEKYGLAVDMVRSLLGLICPFYIFYYIYFTFF